MINTRNYTFSYNTPSVPQIGKRASEMTLDDFNTAIITYDEEVVNYKNNLREIIIQKDYISDRLKKDIMAEVGFATIDMVNNTYTQNIYADKYWKQAISGLNITNNSGITNAINNLTNLYQLFLDKNEEKFSSENNEVIVYDSKALTIDGEKYILSVANSKNNDRVFSQGEKTISYENDIWNLKDVNGNILKTCENIDIEEPIWSELESSSSESTETSSDSSNEPEI